MATVEVTIKYQYEIPDDLEQRQEAYGTTDLQECVKIDEGNDQIAMLADQEWEPEFEVVSE